MAQLVEVRVLGSFLVRIDGGEPVDPRAWRTAKTRDLVRLLAVAGRPVPAERIIEALWPGAEPARGRGSLRTAASQARHVLGPATIVRSGAALELVGAWVDTAAFTALATTARHRLGEGDVSGGLAAAWEAVVLYGGDVCQDEEYADWVVDEREHLHRLLRQLLLDAGEGACAVGWWRDAVELGHQALDLDPCAERAFRVLMRAYSGLGETEEALRTFERCRRHLAEHLGADPDDTTRALHQELLAPQEPPVLAVPFLERGPVLGQVRAAMADVVQEGRPRAVVLTGPSGIGRSRLLHEAAASWSHRRLVLPCRRGGSARDGALAAGLAQVLGRAPAAAPAATEQLRALLGDEPTMLVLDDVHRADQASLRVLARLLEEPALPLLVLAAAPDGLPAGDPLSLASCVSLELPALAREDVAELLAHVLQGPPSRGLVQQLATTSHGRPGALLEQARALLAGGQLLSTNDGMVRVPPSNGVGPAMATAPRLTAVRDRVGPTGGAVLDLLAVLDRPATLAELCRVGDLDRDDAQLALDQLCDLQPVVRRPTGYVLADALVRETAYRWLRPSVSRDLHRRVAELAHVPPAARVEHWLYAGEPALACVAALEAADEALTVGDDASLRAQLRTVRAFAEHQSTDVEEQIALCERLAEVALRLGRTWEAQELLEQAVAKARVRAPAALPRLRRALGRCAPSTEREVSQDDEVGRGPACDDRQQECLAPGAVPAQVRWHDVHALARTVRSADGAGDAVSQVESRLLLAGVSGQRRDFATAGRAAREAMVIAEAAHDDALFVRSALALVRTPALMGDGLRHLELLRRIRDLTGVGAAAAAGGLGPTWCLVLHDLGDPAFERTWQRTAAPARLTGHGRLLDLLQVHFCLERDQPRQARRRLDHLPERSGTSLAQDAAGILRARLLVLEGDPDAAARSLRSVVAERPSGPSLLTPEASARLAALTAAGDPSAAHAHLERARVLTQEHVFPREQVLMLRASAEVQSAADNPSGAATVALAAAVTARRAGLVRLEAEARACHRRLRAAAGTPRRAGPLPCTLPRQSVQSPAWQR